MTSSTGEFKDINLIPVDKIKKGMTITIVNPAFDEFTKKEKAQYLDNLYYSDGSVVVALEDAYYNKAEKQFEFQGLIQYKNGENSIEQLIAFPKYKVEIDKDDLDIIDETLFPTDILAYLNKYIVGQNDAKRKLSIEILQFMNDTGKDFSKYVKTIEDCMDKIEDNEWLKNNMKLFKNIASEISEIEIKDFKTKQSVIVFVEETKQIPPMMAKRLDLIMQNEQLLKDYIDGHNRENARNLRLGKNIEFYELKTDEKEL